jgi:hypothetical protein
VDVPERAREEDKLSPFLPFWNSCMPSLVAQNKTGRAKHLLRDKMPKHQMIVIMITWRHPADFLDKPVKDVLCNVETSDVFHVKKNTKEVEINKNENLIVD